MGSRSSSRTGYTRKQADRVQAALDADMAKIEDAALAMRDRVPDTREYVEGPLEELREVYHRLFATVERRVRR